MAKVLGDVFGGLNISFNQTYSTQRALDAVESEKLVFAAKFKEVYFQNDFIDH